MFLFTFYTSSVRAVTHVFDKKKDMKSFIFIFSFLISAVRWSENVLSCVREREKESDECFLASGRMG